MWPGCERSRSYVGSELLWSHTRLRKGLWSASAVSASNTPTVAAVTRVVCGETHLSGGCSTSKEQLKCCSCGGNHTANYRGCGKWTLVRRAPAEPVVKSGTLSGGVRLTPARPNHRLSSWASAMTGTTCSEGVELPRPKPPPPQPSPRVVEAPKKADGVRGRTIELDHFLAQHGVELCLLNETHLDGGRFSLMATR
jgi:hypothetical protein